MRVVIHKDRCIGAGMCQLESPEIFQQSDEDGLVTCVHEPQTPEEEEQARAAANLCPALTIEIVED